MSENLLRYQSSPYLLQHAHNPVHWHPWGEAALRRAREEDKPILVSIGYSTCHWCHVMERESFEDEAIAALMNENFVCIKVDREERPDVDQIYMEACQAVSGSGGWPLNAFLLPDGRPFYAGTYYPPVSKFNRPAWPELLEHLSKLYREDRPQLESQAARLTERIRRGDQQLLRLEPTAEDHRAWRETMLEKLRGTYDQRYGGFGGAPKFPGSQSLEVLLLNGVLHGAPSDQHLAAHGALAMLDGGIYDQLGGGFSRYTVDAAWRVPHFEKMLYDNALLLRLLAKLQLTRPNPRFAEAIAETTAWLEREMRLPDGGYRAALDADSEGVEGKYYLWDLDEIKALLPPDQHELVAEFYGLTAAGNWEEAAANIPYRPDSLAAVAAKLGVPIDVADAQLASARTLLHEHRFTQRIHPCEDDKVILQWNALLISGWTWCYRATGQEQYLELATGLWNALHELLYRDGRWHRNFTTGQLGAAAFLDDYAALAEAALDLHDVTFDLAYVFGAAAGAVQGAKAMVDHVLRHFSTPEGPMFYLRPPDGSELPVASVDLFDNALPSGNGQIMRSLLRLARMTDDATYLNRAEAMLAALAGSLEKYPGSFGGWAYAALQHGAANRELIITGPGAVAAARQFLSRYRPGLMILASETPREDLTPFVNRYLPNELRFYVCENQACRLPVTTVAEALRQLD
ncbi:thioredoxin domain-containing protein [Neolewinella lacunae]|uniref:Thioredoxin domain-containing protein n=1 Tax=Neolewinella lacunae TaxID=1517758 RepID=A0A923PKX6_9BACT|nr:thioredoxin domain-containing protein [Neolewinella lacunae]MBC6993184.1 thioredoxin domain-containing protein [Neolewinella lacunae]MDN3637103.1 thioredoxin domain-containing protein [Neolewinella lacunae]